MIRKNKYIQKHSLILKFFYGWKFKMKRNLEDSHCPIDLAWNELDETVFFPIMVKRD